MAFLYTRTNQRFRLVWEGDPALKSKKGSDAWVPEEKAKLKSGKRPDVMICRPLSGDEILRIVSVVEEDPSMIIHAAALGVVAIEQGDGAKIEDPDEIRKVIGHARNLEAMSQLAQAIFQASRGGVDSLPFRDESADLARPDHGGSIRSGLSELSEVA